jgi:hypothetical protein
VSQSVSQSVSEKAKLIRGDPPKIALKRRGSPLKSTEKEKHDINASSVNLLTQNTIDSPWHEK